VNVLSRRAPLWALALISLLAAAPAGAQSAGGDKPLFDSRTSDPVRPEAPEDPAAIRARDRLSARLGRHGVLDIDARTGTPRFVGRLDGYLTGPSGADPGQVALDYVRSQPGVFGLSDADVDGLRLVRRYGAGGTTYLAWAQTWRGLTAFDNGLQAAVSADGRLINVSGSPLPDLGARSNRPRLSAGGALAEALDDAGRRGLAPRATPRGGPDRLTTFSGGHDAHLVLFADRRGDVHLAWRVTANAGPGEVYDDVVDANNGDLLFRANTVHAVDAQVHAFEYHPGIGTQSARTVPVDSGAALKGPNAHVYPDVDDDNLPDPDIAAGSGTTWNDAFVSHCPAFCAWDRATANSWQANLRQNGAQAYYLVNTFHDWLRDDPDIAFTAADGAFEGGDALKVEILDGADTGVGSLAGLPDNNHRNNANMQTPADGTSPKMQLFLFTDPDVNAGDDAGIVFHEYTHGLSHRLVSGGLNSLQADAMGEGWSDWYALDYLADPPSPMSPYIVDSAAPGDVTIADYAFPDGLRSQGIDCRPTDGAACPGVGTAGAGGYTFGDFGKVGSATNEHANGEIWSQTLWDLRRELGAPDARRLITTGMRLSVADPSMLEMRNAILQADVTEFAGSHRAALWQVFAGRGMGFTAVSFASDEANPIESFQTPGPGAAVSGRVTDAQTGAPVPTAVVNLAPTASGFVGNVSAVTDANGNYLIAGVPAGTYPLAFVDAAGHTPGFDPDVVVPAAGRTLDLSLVRDYAAASGGARVAAFDGPDYTVPGCGPMDLIDLDYSRGWGSTSHNTTIPNAGGAKSITIALPRAVDVSAFNVDPGAICGDDRTAATGAYRIETSRDGQTFAPAASGRFTSANNHRPNVIAAPPDTHGVQFVRYTMLEPQRQIGSDDGKDFMDSVEFEVYGVPEGFGQAAPPAPPALPPVIEGVGIAAVDRVAPIARAALAGGQRVRTALPRGLRLAVECDEGCAVTLTATIDAKTAKGAKLLSRRSRAKSVTVARGALALGDGPRTTRLRFTSRARKRLKGRRALKLSIVMTVRDTSGNTATQTVKVALTR
jgi:extracellular elastinolytic metalloproteinase